jgi:hypothetical protein
LFFKGSHDDLKLHPGVSGTGLASASLSQPFLAVGDLSPELFDCGSARIDRAAPPNGRDGHDPAKPPT